MAIQQITPVQKRTITKTKKGGGKIGQAIGGLIGGVAGGIAGIAGGPATIVAGATGGAAGGASIGSTIGESISPTKQTTVSAAPAAQNLQAPRLSQQGQEIQQSLLALKEFDPEFQKRVSFPLVTALLQDVQQGQQPQQAPQGLGGFQQQPQGIGSIA